MFLDFLFCIMYKFHNSYFVNVADVYILYVLYILYNFVFSFILMGIGFCRGTSSAENPCTNSRSDMAQRCTQTSPYSGTEAGCQGLCTASSTCLAYEFDTNQCELWSQIPQATSGSGSFVCKKKQATTQAPTPTPTSAPTPAPSSTPTPAPTPAPTLATLVTGVGGTASGSSVVPLKAGIEFWSNRDDRKVPATVPSVVSGSSLVRMPWDKTGSFSFTVGMNAMVFVMLKCNRQGLTDDATYMQPSITELTNQGFTYQNSLVVSQMAMTCDTARYNGEWPVFGKYYAEGSAVSVTITPNSNYAVMVKQQAYVRGVQGAASCPAGTGPILDQNECLQAVLLVMPSDKTQGRTSMQSTTGGDAGCTTQSGYDWAPHFHVISQPASTQGPWLSPVCKAVAYQYVNGPRVDNAAYSTTCSTWYGTFEDAKARCDSSITCQVLHDFACDGGNWRYCDATMAAIQAFSLYGLYQKL